MALDILVNGVQVALNSRLQYSALTVCLLLLAGCADGLPERVPVSGTVLIDGKPLSRGSIMVIPDGQRASGGSIGPDGRFTLSCYELNDGVVPGTHRVTVQATEHISERETRWPTPKKYGNPNTSGLQITVDKPTEDLKIELSWEGKQPFVERM
jgi:hypothetical protein